MKRTAVSVVLSLALAVPVMAELTAGSVVSSGAPFPIVADFNGDGLDDLIQERNVVINHGGTPSEVRSFGIDEAERVVGVLDVNHDGVLDLLTAGSPVAVPAYLPQPPRQGIGYRLYIGDASRNYSTAIDISTNARPYIADVDADGKDDFVVIDGTDATVLRSRGDGTFQSLPTFRIPANPQIMSDSRLLAGDLNHDGLTDLVIRCVNDLVVLRGTGGGAFAVESRHLPNSPAFGTQSARLGDVDGDSHLDVILPVQRGIRVLFGDGRGNFPRSARASIDKLHEIALPAGMEFLVPKAYMEPRNIAVGHFTRSDRAQIAAGTMEGDVVIFSYEQQGGLRETTRTATEFWHTDVRTGSFDGGGTSDLYVGGTLLWGEQMPRPRLFNGQSEAAAATSILGPARRRTARSAPTDLLLNMEMKGDCINEAAAQWRFSRDGVFGLAKRGATTIEAVFDAPSMYFRISAPYAQEPAIGVLTEENGSYSGTVEMMTTCGRKTITISAKGN